MLGAIADDFTGATDLAGNLTARGFRSIVLVGTELIDDVEMRGMDAVVIALKTRTVPPEEAVQHSSRALDFLLELGVHQVYFKYCSTFDSTDTGNIGPVLDMLIQRLGLGATVVVPSFPANGRTVYNGYLFVGEDLLEHSTMKDHPLTPMRQSDLGSLLGRQSRHRVEKITLKCVRAGSRALLPMLTPLVVDQPTIYIVDAITDDDLSTIAQSVQALRLVSGGSGLALGMTGPRPMAPYAELLDGAVGHRAILSGSASSSTGRQVEHWVSQFPSLRVDLTRIQAHEETELQRIERWALSVWEESPKTAVLIYSPPLQGESHRYPPETEGKSCMLERFLARLSLRLVQTGARHLIVAGGETSGAVISKLGLSALHVGPPIAAGVNWVLGENRSTGLRVNLALKSGNFGSPAIFSDAWTHING